jgi:hypothetical protein
MLKDKDYQLWMEGVQSKEEYENTGKVGIFIEEGEIVSNGVDVFFENSVEKKQEVIEGWD